MSVVGLRPKFVVHIDSAFLFRAQEKKTAVISGWLAETSCMAVLNRQ